MATITITFEIVDGLSQRRRDQELEAIVWAIAYSKAGRPRRLIANPDQIQMTINEEGGPKTNQE